MRYRQHESVPFDALLDVLRDDPRVRLVYLFGSRARGEAAVDSDVDVAVLLDRRLSWEQERHLRAVTARAQPNLDLVVLNDAPSLLRREVVADGRCVFARDPREQAEFELVSLSRYLDFQPMRRVQQRYLRERVRERHGSSHRTAS